MPAAKSKIFLSLLLAFVAGIGARSFTEFSSLILLVGTAASLSVAGAGILRKRKDLIFYGFLVFSFFAGILRFDYVDSQAPDVSRWFEKAQEFRGIVREDPALKDTTQKVRIVVSAVAGEHVLPFTVLATVRLYPRYAVGDELLISGKLEQPKNFGDFDYISYLAKESISGTISFPKIERIGAGGGSKIMFTLSEIKHAFEKNIEAILPEPHASFLKGLLLGDRESLPAELVDDFSKTGTTHIIALSGYNITIVGRFFIQLLLILTVPFQISFWIATFGIILFIIMAGASPSLIRAGIMGILLLVAEREGRTYKITNAIVFAAALMVFVNPRILRFDTAFQLSFLATLGLIYLSPVMEKVFQRMADMFVRNRKPLKKKEKTGLLIGIRRMFIETISAQIFVLPLLMYLFGKVSLISPIANILVLVAVPYAMAMGFLAGILGFISFPVAKIFGAIAWILLEYKIRVVEFFANLPGSSVEVGVPAVFLLLMLYAIFYWKFKKTRVRPLFN